MNFEQLEYMKEILETKSITIAAENLHVTQSAISQSISSLEKELGIQLFNRSRNGTVPTKEGQGVIIKALEILKKADELQDEVQAITSTYKGELVIATIPGIFMTFLPKTLAKFKKDFPQIKIEVLEVENNEVFESITRGKADLGLISLFQSDKNRFSEELSFHPLYYQGQFNVIVPSNSVLAYKKEVQLIDLQEYPFILYGEHYYPKLIAAFEEQHGPLTVIFKTTNPEVIKKAVSEGLGISIVSNLMLEDDPYVESGRVVGIPLADYPLNASITFGGIYFKKRTQYRLIEKFLQYFDV